MCVLVLSAIASSGQLVDTRLGVIHGETDDACLDCICSVILQVSTISSDGRSRRGKFERLSGSEDIIGVRQG